jgi:class 3 adenylate cyclase
VIPPGLAAERPAQPGRTEPALAIGRCKHRVDQFGKLEVVNEAPQTRYVAVGDADVAYQVFGDGPIDLVYFYGLGSHIDLVWTLGDRIVSLLRGLSSFARIIMLDRRGNGASGSVPRPGFLTWEEWTEDLTAVLDAVGSQRASILAETEVGPIAILFAALRPERVASLILANTSSRYVRAEDYAIGIAPEAAEEVAQMLEAAWGTPAIAYSVCEPGDEQLTDPQFLAAMATLNRASTTPRDAGAQFRYIFNNMDVRSALPLVQAPTLVIHNTRNLFIPVEHGRYLAEHIPGARLIEHDSGASVLNGSSVKVAEAVLDEMAEFLTGTRPEIEIDRVLTTVLFTDIVGSTERAAAVGDRRWNELLSAHHRAVRAELHRFRGREIDTAGDGFFATFDGPARAIRCACAIREALSPLGLQVRAGLHTGEVEVFEDALRGLAVHIGARVAAAAGPSEVLVSRTVADLVAGSEIRLSDRGEHELKGVPGSWRIFAVVED